MNKRETISVVFLILAILVAILVTQPWQHSSGPVIDANAVGMQGRIDSLRSELDKLHRRDSIRAGKAQTYKPSDSTMRKKKGTSKRSNRKSNRSAGHRQPPQRNYLEEPINE